VGGSFAEYEPGETEKTTGECETGRGGQGTSSSVLVSLKGGPRKEGCLVKDNASRKGADEKKWRGPVIKEYVDGGKKVRAKKSKN